MDLWTFLEEKPNQAFADRVAAAGARFDPNDTLDIKPIGNIGEFGDEILQYMLDHKEYGTIHYFEVDKFYDEEFSVTMSLPGSVGYNRANTLEYYWSDNTPASDEIKEIVGRESIEKAKLDYDTTQVRLIAYLPGNVNCLHMDHHRSWEETYAHLNPHIVKFPEVAEAVKENSENRWKMADRNVCDLGKVVRRIVTINDWEWGHFTQIENAVFPRWKAGDVYNIPPCIYHLGANVGITLKLSMILTGVEAK